MVKLSMGPPTRIEGSFVESSFFKKTKEASLLGCNSTERESE